MQQAWDKQNEFLKAQARAQTTLANLIKQYEEMLHKDWTVATDEQKARIAYMKTKTAAIEKTDESEGENGVEVIVDV